MSTKKTLKFAEVIISNWEDLVRFSEVGDRGFVYRGQSNASWPLITSIERAVNRFSTLGGIEVAERWMLDEFKSKFHLYGNNSPDNSDTFSWLALLQHHGGPTRLLDFTSSLYVAAHFALCDATNSAAIWALNHWAIRDSLRDKLDPPYVMGQALKDEVNRRHISLINNCVPVDDNPSVNFAHLIPLVTTKASLRISRQQGLFFAPATFKTASGRLSFSDCLATSFGLDPSAQLTPTQIDIGEFTNSSWPAEEFACVKLVVPETLHKTALGHLARMGLTEESLFPDIDGLARSLILKHIRR